MSFEEFSLPLYWHGNDRDFFLRGENDDLATNTVTDASASEVFDRTRAYSLVPGRWHGMSGGRRSEPLRASPP
jgi:hypothetical protein